MSTARSTGKPAAMASQVGTQGATGEQCGGAGGTRTPDLRLAKAALSRLSYGPTSTPRERGGWWAILDSNQGPQSYQDCALTT